MNQFYSNEESFTLNYKFTSKEIAALAKFLRQNEENLPDGIENFYKALQDSIYNCLTLDEVRKFYT